MKHSECDMFYKDYTKIKISQPICKCKNIVNSSKYCNMNKITQYIEVSHTVIFN